MLHSPVAPLTVYVYTAAGWHSWIPATGQDAVADHASPDIDFLAFHSWIDNWQPGVRHLKPHGMFNIMSSTLESGIDQWHT